MGKFQKQLYNSIADWFTPETKDYSNRLKGIEQEIKEEHEKEEQMNAQKRQSNGIGINNMKYLSMCKGIYFIS